LVSELKGKQLTVAFGGLTMKVKLAEVVNVIKPDPTPQAAPRPAPAAKRQRSGTTAIRLDTNTLDIRGMRPSEIGHSLAQAIDRSLDLGTLYVIHGRGSGALRASVRQALAEEPMVARFEDATDAEGGNGCTIAYLK
jgi:DNA mismatch repair protein MutS2